MRSAHPPSRLRYLLISLGLLQLACHEAGAPSPPASMKVVAGDNQQGAAGLELPQPVALQLLDAEGGPARKQPVTFTVTAGNGSVVPSLATTDAHGVVQARWTLGSVAGTEQSLLAEISSGPLSLTFHATANAGQPVALARGGKSTGFVYSRAVMPAENVMLVDGFGNNVHRAGIQITAALDQGHFDYYALGGTKTAITDASGVASFNDLVISGSPSSFTDSYAFLKFTAPPFQSMTDTLDVRYGAPAVLKPTGSLTLSRPVGWGFGEHVVVADAYTNGLYGVPVDFTYPANDGSPRIEHDTTNSTGDAFTSFALPTKAGSYSVSATTPVLPSQVVTYTVTMTPGAATQLAIASGDGASAPAGSALPPLVVLVTDQYGNGVPNAGVEWDIASGTGYLSAVSTTTDESGQSAVTLTLTSTPGPVRVRATLAGTTVNVVFALTGT